MNPSPKQWGGKRTPGQGKKLGRKPVPPDQKLVRRLVLLTSAEWLALLRHGKTYSQAIRNLLKEQTKP